MTVRCGTSARPFGIPRAFIYTGRMRQLLRDQRGFTLPELAVVCVLFVLLLAGSLLLLRQKSFDPQLRNAQRRLDIAQIAQAVVAYQAAHDGQLPPGITRAGQQIGSGKGRVNVCPALMPTYLKAMPSDPYLPDPGNCAKPTATYATAYIISSADGVHFAISAQYPELHQRIRVSR